MRTALHRSPHPALAALVGTLTGAVALAAALALEPYVERVVFPLLVASIAVVAWWGGLAAGLAVTAVGALGTVYFFEEPRNSLAVSSPRTVVDLALFVLATLVLSGLSARLRALSTRAEAARREAEAGRETLSRLAALVDFSQDAIIGKSLDGTITAWNPGAEQLYGYRAGDVIGRSISVLVPPDHADEIPEILAQLRAGKRVQHFETARVHKDGHRVDVSVSISPIRDAAGEVVGAVSIARDISERRQLEAAQQELLRLRATTDPLTGLANRGHLDERAAELFALARRHHRPLSCLMLDVDHFKRVND